VCKYEALKQSINADIVYEFLLAFIPVWKKFFYM
jgi:hypothetical protein